jgi:hypothetical protein
MIVVDNNCYRVNPSIRTSPLVEGQYRLYFGDRTTSLKLSASEWEAISDFNSRDGLFDDLFEKCSEFFGASRAGISRDDYLNWLCTHGILLSVEAPTLSAQVSTNVLQANELNGHSNQLNGSANDLHQPPSQLQDRKILLVSFGWITSRGLLRPPRVLIRLQAWLFPLVALLFIGTIHSFYFGVKPLGILIAERSDPLTGLPRLFIMLIVINLISVMVSILSTYSMNIDDQKLYLRLKWGFLPRLAKEQSVKAIKQSASKLEELILLAQPLLIRSYLVILSILFLYVYTPLPDSSPFSRLNILVAIIQGSLASMIILLIPVRNTPGRRLLEFFGVMPKNYLKISAKRTLTIFSHLFHGRFQNISISRSDVNSILFLCTLLLAFIVKLCILYFILIPNIAAEIPTFAGHWTSLIVRVALTLLLIRFLYLTVITKLINKRVEGRPDRSINRATNGPALLPSSSGQQSTESIAVSSSTLSSVSVHNRITNTFKSRYFLPFILVVIFLFPFSASVTGSANVTEGAALDIRATEAATVRSIFQVGPSSAILDKGSKILELFSPNLSTQRSQQLHLISKLESDIRTKKSLIRSIKTGSIKLEGDNRNEELLSARAMVQKSQSRVRALENQIRIQDDQIEKLKSLTKSGAISEFQLQNLLSTQAALSGADVIVARRKQKIDQDINAEEQLSNAMDELSAAESSLKVGNIALEAIDSRLAKLVVTMPFDGVISTNTRALLGRTVTTGETIVTVKAQPLTQTIVLIPEYDRARVRTTLPCILRLYSVSNEEFKGSVSSISPTTVEIDGLQYVELQIQLEESLPTNFIGSKGYAKIDVGFTCILFILLAPVTRFVNVDLWSLLP